MADEILDRLADGETLTAICDAPDMPSRRAVYVWVDQRPDFSERFATARLRQADKHYDELVRAAREAKELTDNAKVQAYRLYVDTMKWAASKLRPATYGDQSHKTLTVIGGSYSQLLESLDRREEMKDVTPKAEEYEGAEEGTQSTERLLAYAREDTEPNR